VFQSLSGKVFKSPQGDLFDSLALIRNIRNIQKTIDRGTSPSVLSFNSHRPDRILGVRRHRAKTRHDWIQYCQQALSDLHYRSSERPEVSENSWRTKQAWVE
jgi:hypothetical protein